MIKKHENSFQLQERSNKHYNPSYIASIFSVLCHYTKKIIIGKIKINF